MAQVLWMHISNTWPSILELISSKQIATIPAAIVMPPYSPLILGQLAVTLVNDKRAAHGTAGLIAAAPEAQSLLPWII